MSRPVSLHAQRGVTLVIGLIMLVLLTLIVTTAFSLSSTNLRSVGNMQFRDEAIAAANMAIELKISSNLTVAPAAEDDLPVDIDNDGDTDYLVDIEVPRCVRASQAISTSLSSVTLPGMSSSSFWNSVWDFNTTVSDANSGANIRIHQGVRVLLTETQKNAICA
jgi:hypothetical protein